MRTCRSVDPTGANGSTPDLFASKPFARLLHLRIQGLQLLESAIEPNAVQGRIPLFACFLAGRPLLPARISLGPRLAGTGPGDRGLGFGLGAAPLFDASRH